MTKTKKLLSSLMTCILVVSMVSANVSASETKLSDDVIATSNQISTRSGSLEGFNYDDGSDGVFQVDVKGEDQNTGYVTIRIEGASDQKGIVYFQIIGPDGGESQIWNTNPANGEEQKFKFSKAPAGIYRVIYWTEHPVQNIRFNCWIYG